MNTRKKLICTLAVGTALAAASPVFADGYNHYGYDHERRVEHSRDYDRHEYRDYNRNHVVVVRRPVIVERPAYYREPAPVPSFGIGAMIGAAIGSLYDYQH
jgi:hypothetical protein